MNIESHDLKQALIEIKERMSLMLDRSTKNKVRDIFISNISVIESILIWINNSEKQGAINMEELNIGVGKTVKLSDIIEIQSNVDRAIMKEAKHLEGAELGTGREIDPKMVNVTYFYNRVYTLAKQGKIPADAKPMKTRSGKLYIMLKKSKKREKSNTVPTNR